MPITGIQVGGSGVFQALTVPSNAVPFQSVAFVSSDPLVTLTQDPTDQTKVTAAVDASDTAASFQLTVNAVNGVGAPLTHVFTIPLTAAPPPQAVDIDLNQLS